MAEHSINNVIKSVCRMPGDFQKRGDVSMIALLKESGYLPIAESITEPLLKEYFEQYPDLIDAWLRNSEDTRSSPNWYLHKPANPNKQWVVGFFPNGMTHRFAQGAEACAFYVKRYLEALMK